VKNQDKYPLVYCVWEDIVQGDTSWKELDTAIHWTDSESGLVSQTGFMLEKSDEHLILIDSFFNEGDLVGSVTRIPMSVVRVLKQIPIQDLIK
jgi:hypothetical protein